MKLLDTIFLFLISISCFPQAGTLDETFGNGGKVLTDFNGRCLALMLQPDGKIVAGGAAYNEQFTLLRFLSDGALDASFGVGGIVDNSFSYGDILAVAVLPDEGILASGFGDGGMAAAKYKEDGV